jgi:hypothetical protein
MTESNVARKRRADGALRRELAAIKRRVQRSDVKMLILEVLQRNPGLTLVDLDVKLYAVPRDLIQKALKELVEDVVVDQRFRLIYFLSPRGEKLALGGNPRASQPLSKTAPNLEDPTYQEWQREAFDRLNQVAKPIQPSSPLTSAIGTATFTSGPRAKAANDTQVHRDLQLALSFLTAYHAALFQDEIIGDQLAQLVAEFLGRHGR